jgi:DNA-binding transcriptional regulator YdaS (Cro superfamily)
MLDVVTKAAENAGGVVKLAEALGIKHQSFYSWDRVPAERALDIARIADVHPSQVRSDLYPAPSEQEAAQ